MGIVAVVGVILAGLAAPQVAQAIGINGSFSMAEGMIPVNAAGASTTLLAATGIDFFPAGGGIGNFTVFGVSTGDYSALISGDAGIIKDFMFNAAPIAGFPAAPIATFWTIIKGGITYTLDLTTVVINTQNATTLALNGTGLAHITGFDNTPGVWNFSAQTAGGSTFSWSASTGASTVPEPATMFLVLTGLGLIAFGSAARRRLFR